MCLSSRSFIQDHWILSDITAASVKQYEPMELEKGKHEEIQRNAEQGGKLCMGQISIQMKTHKKHLGGN